MSVISPPIHGTWALEVVCEPTPIPDPEDGFLAYEPGKTLDIYFEGTDGDGTEVVLTLVGVPKRCLSAMERVGFRHVSPLIHRVPH